MSSCSLAVTLESVEIELGGRAHYTVLLLTVGGTGWEANVDAYDYT